MGGDFQPYIQLITGGADMRAMDQMYGVPGTGYFRYPDPARGHFMQQAAQTAFPAGVIRNLRVRFRLDRKPEQGKVTIEIHSTSLTDGKTGTGLLVQIDMTGQDQLIFSGEKLGYDVQVAENDAISIKADNSLVGPTLIGFTYSFEFELA